MWWVEVGSRNFFKNIYSNLNFNLPSNLRDNPIFFFYCFVFSALFRLDGEDLPVSRIWKKKEREREKYRMRRPQVRCLVPSPLLLNYFRFFSARSGINEVALQINVAWSLKEKKKKRERVQGKDKRRERKKRVKKKIFWRWWWFPRQRENYISWTNDPFIESTMLENVTRAFCSNAITFCWQTVSPKEKLRA